MATGAEEPRIYEFGPFRLDPAERRFHRDGQAVPLTPKAFDLLVYLVARHGRLVEKQTLIAALWPDTVVEEANLAYNISALRKVLDDDDATSLIETVPTRGYRFVGPVTDGSTTNRGTISPSQPRKHGVVTSVLVLVALVAAGFWALVSWRTRVQPLVAAEPIARDLTRLTFEPGLQTGPSWSPDGRSIAYASDKTGNFDIWVRRIDDGATVQLTRSPAQDSQPAWSPDGNSVVFRSERDGGGLFMVPASGGPERRLTSFGFRPKWSPDGSQILFTSAHVQELGRFRPKLFVVRPDGATPREVLSQSIGRFHHMEDWSWYPHSQQVSVMGGGETQGWGIFTMPLSGEPLTLVDDVEGRLGDWRAFEWAPQGEAVYVKSWSRWTSNILKLTVDRTAMKVSGAERVTANDSADVNLALSRDGKRLAFTISKPRMRLWSFPLDAAGRISGTAEPMTDAEAMLFEFDLSRDGRALAYALGHVGTMREELWATSLTDRRDRQLAGDDQVRRVPVWSRDGSRLAYVWQRGPCTMPQNSYALAVRRMDTAEEKLMMTPRGTGTVGYPSDWSPDGEWVLASSHGSGQSSLGLWPLAAAPHADTAVKVLTSDKDYDLWDARNSPDGKWIVFVAYKTDDPSVSIVFVMPGAGAGRGHWIALSGDRESTGMPRWSPDGKLVYYSKSDGAFWNIWAARFDGNEGRAVGKPFQVTHFDSPRWHMVPPFADTGLGVSARRLVLSMSEQTGSIWMLDNVDR